MQATTYTCSLASADMVSGGPGCVVIGDPRVARHAVVAGLVFRDPRMARLGLRDSLHSSLQTALPDLLHSSRQAASLKHLTPGAVLRQVWPLYLQSLAASRTPVTQANPWLRSYAYDSCRPCWREWVAASDLALHDSAHCCHRLSGLRKSLSRQEQTWVRGWEAESAQLTRPVQDLQLRQALRAGSMCGWW